MQAWNRRLYAPSVWIETTDKHPTYDDKLVLRGSRTLDRHKKTLFETLSVLMRFRAVWVRCDMSFLFTGVAGRVM